jgi:hypothetical protein
MADAVVRGLSTVSLTVDEAGEPVAALRFASGHDIRLHGWAAIRSSWQRLSALCSAAMTSG